MQNKFCIEAVDRTLRDVTKNITAFGGITVVLGGDFRQTLPVIQRGCREQIVGASIRRSVLWNNVIVLKLTQNMRLGNEDTENVEFAEFLLQVCQLKFPLERGERINFYTRMGTDPEPKIKLPQTMYRCANLSELISKIYPGIEGHNIPTAKYLTERTILSPRNEDVAAINDVILNMYQGSYRSYMAADKLAEDLEKGSSGNMGCPSESLNAMNPPGLPPFNLKVKVGSPVILRVEYCGGHVIEDTILTGDKQGQLVFIPRISLTPSSSDLMVRISRRQFPIRLAYAMTINKSQGQSVKFVGIDLRTPVFCHGQLYVALSRCTTARRIKLLMPENSEGNETDNVVYPEILL
ncbi:hypothetical protein MKW98_004753 [Papaver atlanticum]|uniref:ATP-dependent DNA helicase n=1 Tax=Papaver atlanticum TaxID=357466 RepID=A0AAD4SNP0_9MAGN|nr:hypothetical protein MKW98_004753 [Papaver atlanticum]